VKAVHGLLGLVLLISLAAAAFAAPGGHYVPQTGDGFHYYEEITVANGYGDYRGYTEATFINGSVGVTAVAPNGTESATYATSWTYSNNSGGYHTGSGHGTFTFSADSFLYVQGTDNQTGYTNPTVWFYLNNSSPTGSTVELLNTYCTVVSTNQTYQFPNDPSRYVKTISTEGSSQYVRDDSYGNFDASYTWQSYFDPSTGYIVGYLYTEHDSNASGDGFTYTDVLSVTSTTYPLTAASPSSSNGTGGSGSGDSYLLILAIVLIVVVVIVVVIVAALRARRRSSLPRHSAGGRVEYGTVPTYSPPPPSPGTAPPPIHLTGVQQPAVQQVVVRETVKVNCRYCGTLIDSTATVCPNCGAPRT
jgi:hypothetical protein